ncbi:hypothetical protein RZS08_22140, partial [Arthrospira platensis SPKY1]|nr:hypothetical protein [Arthrospira platensis SPKY1]
MHAAGQHAFVGTHALQQRTDNFGVPGLAAVAGAQQRDVRVAQAQPVRGLVHQRHGLQRFERRAGEHRGIDIAGPGQQASGGVGHGDRSVVDVLGVFAAQVHRHRRMAGDG